MQEEEGQGGGGGVWKVGLLDFMGSPRVHRIHKRCTGLQRFWDLVGRDLNGADMKGPCGIL